MFKCTWGKSRCNMCDSPLDIMVTVTPSENMELFNNFHQLDINNNVKKRAYIRRPCVLCTACDKNRRYVKKNASKFLRHRELTGQRTGIQHSITQKQLKGWWDEFEKSIKES